MVSTAGGTIPIRKVGRACKDCHDDKCKCVWSTPTQSKCDRCLRQNRLCIPRISRQGERPRNEESDNSGKKTPPLATDLVMKNPTVYGNSQLNLTAMGGPYPNMTPHPSVGWNASLISALHPVAGAPSNSTALQAYLTSHSKNLNMSNSNDGALNQSVLATALNSVPAPNSFLNQGGLQSIQDNARTATLLSLMRNDRDVTSMNSSAQAFNPYASHQDQMYAALMQRGHHQLQTSEQTQQVWMKIIDEQVRQQQRQGFIGTAGSQQSQQGFGAEQGGNEDTKKRSSDDISFDEGKPKSKKARDNLSQSQRELEIKLQQEQQRVIEPPVSLEDHLIEILSGHTLDLTTLKTHFGVQALIRELISCAFSNRSFEMLSKASALALKFGTKMDRILSGEDAEMDKVEENLKACIGGRMNYLLPKLLDRSDTQKDSDMPSLPRSLLAHIAPPSCTSFEALDVSKRWIFIRETYQGDTKLYCSPMFQKNVLAQTQLPLLRELGIADVFSLIFTTEETGRALKCLAVQIALHQVEDSDVGPVNTPTRIRTAASSPAENCAQVANNTPNSAISVDMMLLSIQTMDRHTCYLEFFAPKEQAGNEVSNTELPPSYYEVKKKMI
eukprot:scaffold297413_cov83-Cyclotella_meneghiniana.AAC.1